THLISGMGGIDGRPVRAGDRLPLGDPRRGRGPTAALANPILALPQGGASIRVLPGPQREYFADDALEVLQSGPYTIAQNSDRMGFRLEGPPLSHARGADIISDATPLGALQGPAEWFLETRSSDELVSAVKLAGRGGVPVTILGGGSNVLIADAGVRGLVIRPRGGTIAAIGEGQVRADAAVTINGLVRWTITH